MRKPGWRRRRRWCARRGSSCSIPSSGCGATRSPGTTSLYATCPIERAFRDVHAITQHIGVHPRILETAGRVLFGLEPDVPLSVL